MNKYYTVDQIAELLTLHPKTVQRYIREGKIIAQKVGKRWCVSENNLNKFTGLKRNLVADNNPVFGAVDIGAEKDVCNKN